MISNKLIKNLKIKKNNKNNLKKRNRASLQFAIKQNNKKSSNNHKIKFSKLAKKKKLKNRLSIEFYYHIKKLKLLQFRIIMEITKI
jgi:hypothetical protein